MPVLSPKIAASSDDAQENGSTGAMDIVNAAVRPGTGGANLYGGFRFPLDADQGSTINSSSLDCYFPNTGQDNIGWRIRAELIVDSPTFTTTAFDISSRTLTTAFVDWVDTNVATSGVGYYSSPDLSTVVQEVVDQALFVKNNHISFIVTGISGNPNIASYDRSPTGTLGAIMNVDYTAPAPSGLSIPVAMNHLRNQRIS